MTVDERLISARFPRASAYHPEWVLAGVSGGANPLWMTEWLAAALNYLARFVKPGGPLGIAGAGLMREVDESIPTHLKEWWAQDLPWCLHSAEWWRRHWGRTGILDIAVADTLPEGWRFWLDWLRLV